MAFLGFHTTVSQVSFIYKAPNHNTSYLFSYKAGRDWTELENYFDHQFLIIFQAEMLNFAKNPASQMDLLLFFIFSDNNLVCWSEDDTLDFSLFSVILLTARLVK